MRLEWYKCARSLCRQKALLRRILVTEIWSSFLTKGAQQRCETVLCSLYLLVLKVQLMPLITRVKVVSVDDMIPGTCCRFKHLICLIVICLQKVLKVEAGIIVACPTI